MKRMSNCRLWPARICPGNQRQGLTLIELLVVLGIIVTIAGMLLFMLNGAREESRRLRTVAQVRRVNQVVAERWEEVGFQPVQLNEASRNVVANALPAAKLGLSRNLKLSATRELQRLEFPDRISDLAVFPQFGAPTPAWLNYRLKVQVAFGTTDWTNILTRWTDNHEGAECLYLILSAIFDEDGHALRFFSQNEIGDIDKDGMPEIWDAWGNPIEFLRWAPGYLSPYHEQNGVATPDPFDPFRSDPRFATPTEYFDTRDGIKKPLVPFNLYPLVFSAGPDAVYGVAFVNEPAHSDGGVRKVEYANLAIPNDPFPVDDGDGYMIGATGDFDGDGVQGHEDNIDNHWDIR